MKLHVFRAFIIAQGSGKVNFFFIIKENLDNETQWHTYHSMIDFITNAVSLT